MVRDSLFKVFVIGILTLIPLSADANDAFRRAKSLEPTPLRLCGVDEPLEQLPGCKNGAINDLVRRADGAFQKVLATAGPTATVLLKRDQVWFRELIENSVHFGGDIPDDDSDAVDTQERNVFAEMLRERIATLEGIRVAPPGMPGRWENVFATIDVAAAGGGAYRLVLTRRFNHDSRRAKRAACAVIAMVRPDPSGWLVGKIESYASNPAEASNPATTAENTPLPSVKIRRQGETLRVVAFDASGNDELDLDALGCSGVDQMTGSYFAVGAAGNGGQSRGRGSAFLAPSFDCSRVATAVEEEICADPELAENDVRLNRAWARLLPRLDEATRRALTVDQRGYVGSQADQYPEFLHPAWEKRLSHVHHTTYGRDKVNRLQRERIAVLEGFDEKRQGFAGLWMAHSAILEVTVTPDGTLQGQGAKWTQGDWKAGCGYEIKGKVTGGVFRSEEERVNPDTLERDHASLSVNRLDDVFAKRRQSESGEGGDGSKCRRNFTISSTARLFPVRPSTDIDNIGGDIR